MTTYYFIELNNFIIPRYIPYAGQRLRNFEIRVGNDGEEIGNNAICHKQLEAMELGATKSFTCSPEKFGSWISINKSDDDPEMVFLHFQEVRVYGGKCN